MQQIQVGVSQNWAPQSHCYLSKVEHFHCNLEGVLTFFRLRKCLKFGLWCPSAPFKLSWIMRAWSVASEEVVSIKVVTTWLENFECMYNLICWGFFVITLPHEMTDMSCFLFPHFFGEFAKVLCLVKTLRWSWRIQGQCLWFLRPSAICTWFQEIRFQHPLMERREKVAFRKSLLRRLKMFSQTCNYWVFAWNQGITNKKHKLQNGKSTFYIFNIFYQPFCILRFNQIRVYICPNGFGGILQHFFVLQDAACVMRWLRIPMKFSVSWTFCRPGKCWFCTRFLGSQETCRFVNDEN